MKNIYFYHSPENVTKDCNELKDTFEDSYAVYYNHDKNYFVVEMKNNPSVIVNNQSINTALNFLNRDHFYLNVNKGGRLQIVFK